MKEVTETESNRKETRNATGSLISSTWNMVVVLAYLFLYMSVLQLLLLLKRRKKERKWVMLQRWWLWTFNLALPAATRSAKVVLYKRFARGKGARKNQHVVQRPSSFLFATTTTTTK